MAKQSSHDNLPPEYNSSSTFTESERLKELRNRDTVLFTVLRNSEYSYGYLGIPYVILGLFLISINPFSVIPKFVSDNLLFQIFSVSMEISVIAISCMSIFMYLGEKFFVTFTEESIYISEERFVLNILHDMYIITIISVPILTGQYLMSLVWSG